MSRSVGNLVATMRKLILATFILFLISFIGCKKEDEKTPTIPTASISLSEIGKSIKVLETINYALEASFPAGLKSANAVIWLNDQLLQTVVESGQDSLLFSISDNFTFEVLPQYSGENIIFAFSVTDMLDRIAADTIALSIEESGLQLIENKTIASFNNSAIGSFYDIKNDTSYFGVNIRNSTPLKKAIDFAFFFTVTNKRSLSSPSNIYAENSWKSQSSALWPLFGAENKTKLYDLGTDVNYDDLIAGVQISNIISAQSSPVDSLLDIQAGQYIGFELDSLRNSNQGIIKVISVDGKTVSNSTITFDAKLQQ